MAFFYLAGVGQLIYELSDMVGHKLRWLEWCCLAWEHWLCAGTRHSNLVVLRFIQGLGVIAAW
jgi:hypothetical protein